MHAPLVVSYPWVDKHRATPSRRATRPARDGQPCGTCSGSTVRSPGVVFGLAAFGLRLERATLFAVASSASRRRQLGRRGALSSPTAPRLPQRHPRWRAVTKRDTMQVGDGAGAGSVGSSAASGHTEQARVADVYISADVETDGPIPGPYSMLSFALVEIGRFDGEAFVRPEQAATFYRELQPISSEFEAEALAVNGLDRGRLLLEGSDPLTAMDEARVWVRDIARGSSPVLVAYPLSFDWTWLYWYFMRFGASSPFSHSRCFDIKTAYAVKARRMVSASGRDRLPVELRPALAHTHHALDDAREQAEIFARLFAWEGPDER